MAVWGGTKTNMTVDGSNDLMLDADAMSGKYETGSIDCGSLDWYNIACEVAWEEDDDSVIDVGTAGLYFSTSPDNAAWTDWEIFEPAVRYFRYYKMEIRVTGDPFIANRPKVTRFELSAAPAHGGPNQMTVINSTVLDSAGATVVAGNRYLINGGGANDFNGKDNMIAICMESTTPTWEFIQPREGMEVYDVTNSQKLWYRSAAWRTEDATTALKGIVELATDGENASDKAVQGDDARVNEGMHGHDGDSAAASVGSFGTIATYTPSASELDDKTDSIRIHITARFVVGIMGAHALRVEQNGTTVWTVTGLASAVDYDYVILLTQASDTNTVCLAKAVGADTSPASSITLTRTAGLTANWIEANEAITADAQAQGGGGGTCFAQITSIRTPT